VKLTTIYNLSKYFTQLCSFVVVLIAVPLSYQVQASEGNAEAGKEKSQVCQGCHGTDGNSYGPEWPNLASQHVSYITKQISNFQSGARVNETMTGMVAGLSAQDAKDIAAFFSSQTVKPSTLKIDSETIKTGRKIYKGGNVYSGVPACAGCHGPNAVGNGPAAFPYLAGQVPTYLIKTLKDFRSGARANDPNEIMRNIAAKLTDNEITAVSNYVATLPH